MTDIRTIIEEALRAPTMGSDCPHCGAVGSVGVPMGADVAMCYQCQKPVVDNDDNPKVNTPKDMKPTNPDATPSNTKSDVFERLMPMQLNALMETLIRNKKQFDALYSALASEGFVPLMEGADYESKRTILSEMLKDGAFTKHMLETLVEMNHLEVKQSAEDKDDDSDDEEDNEGEEEGGEGGASLADFMKPGKKSEDDEDEKEPTEIDDVPTDDDVDLSKVGQAKQVINVAQMSLNDVMAKLIEYAGIFGFDTPKEVEVETTDEDGNVVMQKKTLSPLGQLVQHYNEWKKTGTPSPVKVKNTVTGELYTFTPEDQLEYMEDIRQLMEKGKEETSKKHMAQKTIKPPVNVSINQPVEVDEAKNKQLKMGTGKSELQLRAGAKGKIFESRMKRLEPYKKIALLEFLENDPRMLDDQDYSDMSTLTGICEEELVLMRMEYENKSDDVIAETINYPVFGGKDVRGENAKTAQKQLTRDVDGASKSQETTEEKVFKAKKFRLEDIEKSSIENTDKQDQNRGQHSLVAALNDKDGSQKERYEAQADGYPSAENAKMHEKMPDANRANDGGKASEREDADVGGALLKKGEEQEIERQNEPIYPKEQVPTTGGKEKPRKMVSEDIDRIKNLFSYDTGAYIKPKAKATAEKIFEQQLRDMRIMSDLVDNSDRPTKEQLMEMTECEYQGKKARTDGTNYFNEEGYKLGECGAMEEGEGVLPADSIASLRADIANIDRQIAQLGPAPSRKKSELSTWRTQLYTKLRQMELGSGKSMEEARGHQLEAGQEIDPKQLYAGTRAKDFASREFDMNKLEEGTMTEEYCTECGHKIWEVKGKKKCMCKGEPTPKKKDLMEGEIQRQLKLAGVKTKTVKEGFPGSDWEGKSYSQRMTRDDVIEALEWALGDIAPGKLDAEQIDAIINYGLTDDVVYDVANDVMPSRKAAQQLLAAYQKSQQAAPPTNIQELRPGTHHLSTRIPANVRKALDMVADSSGRLSYDGAMAAAEQKLGRPLSEDESDYFGMKYEDSANIEKIGAPKNGSLGEAKHQQLKHSKGTQLKTGTAKEEVIDEAKNKQLKHSKGLQLKAGTKTTEEEK